MDKAATLYRMVTDEHVCPYGLKSRDLLRREGFKVDDHLLTSEQETKRFKEQEGVKTTPQAFIDGQRVGGYDDLLPYAFVYPFIEGLAGVAMLAGLGMRVAGAAAFLIGVEGALSVIKAVFVEKRELKCACVGGHSNVPLGTVSLTENLMMVGMGLWAMAG